MVTAASKFHFFLMLFVCHSVLWNNLFILLHAICDQTDYQNDNIKLAWSCYCYKNVIVVAFADDNVALLLKNAYSFVNLVVSSDA